MVQRLSIADMDTLRKKIRSSWEITCSCGECLKRNLKQLHIGIGDQMGRTIFSILKDNGVTILDGNQLSGEISTDFGVSHSDKLSPLLFSLLLADLSTLSSNTVCRTFFYADDLAIRSTVSDHKQHPMRTLEMYCSEKHFNVSVDKSRIIKFRNGGPLA